MKKRVPRRAPPGRPNLAAKALGSKIFGLKVVSPKRGYSRKVKHRKGSTPDTQLSSFVLQMSEIDGNQDRAFEFTMGSSLPI